MTLLTFFSQAPDTSVSGTPAYAQATLRFNYQYFLTSLIEISYAPSRQILLLVLDGNPASCYHVHDGLCEAIQPEQIEEIWTEGEASIRSILVPREALRMVKAVIEWQPAVQNVTLETVSIQEYLSASKDLPSPSLIHFNSLQAGYYVLLYQGAVLPSETIISTSTGVEAGSHAFRNQMNGFAGPCTIHVYPGKPETLAYQQHLLRISLSRWVNEILRRYQQLVGRSMLANLSSDLNSRLKARSWNIQIVGDSISDSGSFPSIEASASAYQALFRAASAHILNVIGANLTQAIFTETYQNLEPSEQEVLRAHALAPAQYAPGAVLAAVGHK